jgi:N,N'-diacetyllegionaminate synthase
MNQSETTAPCSVSVPVPPIVFEVGLNHLGDALRARRMIDTLATSGATHMTVQVVTDPTRITRDPSAIAFLNKAVLPLDEVHSLVRYASDNGLVAGATVLDEEDVPGLVEAGARIFKILSSDLTYVPLILAAGRTGYPTYLSTAAATLGEIEDVLAIVREQIPHADLRLIHTVLEIPTPVAHINLRNITTLRESLGIPVAYGQHSDVREALLVAAVLGADALFVYVAEARTENLPDGPHAVLCAEVAALLDSIRRAVGALGSAERPDDPNAESLRRRIRRSAVAIRPLAAGHRVTLADIVFRRPGTGIEPYHVDRILGRTLAQAVAAGDDLSVQDSA